MYNKLFNKLPFSSIWQESKEVRILWTTLLAAMDQEGYVYCATIGSLSRLANLTVEETELALKVLMAPDPNSSRDNDEGRRVAKYPGVYEVINAKHYNELSNREKEREQTRIRVAKYKERKKGNGKGVTKALPCVTSSLPTVNPVSVYTSEYVSLEGKDSLKGKGTKEACRDYAIEIGLLATDGEAFFDGKEGNGWMNGSNQVKDWRATMRSWKAQGFHPSQKGCAKQSALMSIKQGFEEAKNAKQ